jgi:hypothetical protein
MPSNLQPFVDKLIAGETVHFRPVGNSMTPKIYSKQLITVSPDVSKIELGDVLVCKVNGNILVHLVSAIQSDRIQISNNHGHVNGWTNRSKIYGKVIKIED